MRKKVIDKIILNIILFAVAVFSVFPLMTLIITSFKSDNQIISDPYGLIPNPFSFDAYKFVFENFRFAKYMGNTFIIVVTNIIGVPLTSAMAGYAFSRFNVAHKKYIFGTMFAMIMVPGTVLQIPTFELFRTLGWINTFYPFIVPAFLGGGISNVFLIRQFLNSLPLSLFEAAEIDGASEPTMFVKLAVPLALPIITTVAIFTFSGVWNDFFSPLLYLNDENKYTLAYGLYIFISQCKIGTMRAWNAVCASCMFVMIPMFIVFAFAQKYFVEGITITGIKG